MKIVKVVNYLTRLKVLSSKMKKPSTMFIFFILLIVSLFFVYYYHFKKNGLRANITNSYQTECDQIENIPEMDSCLFKLQETKDKEVDGLVNDMSKIKSDEFVKDLTSLYPKWKQYKKDFCIVHEDNSLGGSGWSAYISKCEAEQDNLFIKSLKQIQATWPKSG